MAEVGHLLEVNPRAAGSPGPPQSSQTGPSRAPIPETETSHRFCVCWKSLSGLCWVEWGLGLPWSVFLGSVVSV